MPSLLQGIEDSELLPRWDTVRRLANGLETSLAELGAAVEDGCGAQASERPS
jgi:hypothetical protein